MSILYNGNCLDEMANIDDNSVDLIYTDLPYATKSFGKCTDCEWDKPIDLDKMWSEFMRIKKLHTPIFMSCNVKLGYDLMRTCPKKCPFRYELIWSKTQKSGFLLSKKQPLRSHELIYVFYEKQPYYDISSHKVTLLNSKNGMKGQDDLIYGKSVKQVQNKQYDPPLPTAIIKDVIKGHNNTYNTEGRKKPLVREKGGKYEPPLPDSLLEIKSERGQHQTQKPVELMSWILKYYSKPDDVVFDCCMGSGSMGVACVEMDRKFIGIELNPKIYDVAVGRIEG